MTTLFFSYSHRDETWRDELEIHLQSLQRQGLIDTWHDRRILAGDQVHDSISEHLESASIILLLISPYFIASDYCYNVEMTRALERHRTGEARVVPVILEPCVWHELPFGSLRATPNDGKPVSKFSNPHDAFVDVVNAIKDALPPAVPNKSHSLQSTPVLGRRPDGTAVRSSNLRVRKVFTDEDNHQFLENAFEYIARFFEGSVNEIEARNPGITAQFRRIDANRFDVVLFRRGHEMTSGTVWLGSVSGTDRAIYYATGLQSGTNSYNECLSVTNDGYAQFLRGFGFFGSADENLSEHGAAEHLWRQLIEHLQ